MKLSIKLGLVILGVVIAGLGARPARAENREARGTATNVTNSSLTLAVGNRDLTFAVNSSTNVEVAGAGHRTRQAREAGVTGFRRTLHFKRRCPGVWKHRPLGVYKSGCLDPVIRQGVYPGVTNSVTRP